MGENGKGIEKRDALNHVLGEPLLEKKTIAQQVRYPEGVRDWWW